MRIDGTGELLGRMESDFGTCIAMIQRVLGRLNVGLSALTCALTEDIVRMRGMLGWQSWMNPYQTAGTPRF